MGNLFQAAPFWFGNVGRGLSQVRTLALGKDDTLFAKVTGQVRFEDKGRQGRFISIYPVAS